MTRTLQTIREQAALGAKLRLPTLAELEHAERLGIELTPDLLEYRGQLELEAAAARDWRELEVAIEQAEAEEQRIAEIAQASRSHTFPGVPAAADDVVYLGQRKGANYVFRIEPDGALTLLDPLEYREECEDVHTWRYDEHRTVHFVPRRVRDALPEGQRFSFRETPQDLWWFALNLERAGYIVQPGGIDVKFDEQAVLAWCRQIVMGCEAVELLRAWHRSALERGSDPETLLASIIAGRLGELGAAVESDGGEAA